MANGRKVYGIKERRLKRNKILKRYKKEIEREWRLGCMGRRRMFKVVMMMASVVKLLSLVKMNIMIDMIIK